MSLSSTPTRRSESAGSGEQSSPRTCTLDGKPVHARGLCSAHYQQQRTHEKTYAGMAHKPAWVPDAVKRGRPKVEPTIWKRRTPSGELTNGTVKGGFDIDESRRIFGQSEESKEYERPHRYEDHCQQSYQIGSATGGKVEVEDYNSETGREQMLTHKRFLHDAKCHLGRTIVKGVQAPNTATQWRRSPKVTPRTDTGIPRTAFGSDAHAHVLDRGESLLDYSEVLGLTQNYSEIKSVVQTYVDGWTWVKAKPFSLNEKPCHSARYFRPSRFGDPADRRTKATCSYR